MITRPDDEYGYCIYYPEGSGYLFVGAIATGAQASADVVWSCANVQGQHDKYYVRKKTFTDLAPAEYAGDASSRTRLEVLYQRSFPNVPRLIDWTQYRATTRGSRYYQHVNSTSMIFQYCNNGDLESLIRRYADRRTVDHQSNDVCFSILNCQFQHASLIRQQRHISIPEAFIWKVLGQLLNVVNNFLHARPGIYHNDIWSVNVFLNRDNSEDAMPDVYLGDYGRATTMMHYDSWTASGHPTGPRVRLDTTDLEAIVAIVKCLMLCEARFGDLERPYLENIFAQLETMSLPNTQDQTVEQWQMANIASGPFYSPQLFAVVRSLEARIANSRSTHTIMDWSDIANNALSESASRVTATPDQVAFPVLDNLWEQFAHRACYKPAHRLFGPMFLDDEFLKGTSWPSGPFKIAKVNKQTMDVVAMSRRTYLSYYQFVPNFRNRVARKYQRRMSSVSLPKSSRETSGLNLAINAEVEKILVAGG